MTGMHAPACPPLSIGLFGPVVVEHSGAGIAVPPSRKARAILGYLLLAPAPVSRMRLCDLMFDEPDDPRAALRWCLSKLRPLVDAAQRQRLLSDHGLLRIDVTGIAVDALSLRHIAGNMRETSTSGIEHVLARMEEPLLADADLPDRPEFSAWLAVARADCHAMERRLVDELLQRATGHPARQCALWKRRISIDPCDEAAYVGLAGALVQRGLRAEARATVESAERALQSEGIRPTDRLRYALESRSGAP